MPEQRAAARAAQVVRRACRSSAGVLLLALLLDWLRQVGRLKVWGNLRGPWPVPLLGSLHRMLLIGLTNLHRLGLRDQEEFGNIFGWSYFWKPMASISCPHALRRVFVKQWKKYDRSDIEQTAFVDLLGRGLILVGNDAWSEMRRLYQAGFSDGNISRFNEVIRLWADEFASSLLSASAEGAVPVDIQAALQRVTFRIIGLFTLGLDFEAAEHMEELRSEMGSGPWCCQNYGHLWAKLLEHTQMRFPFGPFQWWTVIKTREVGAFERGHALLLRAIDRAIDDRKSGASDAAGSGSGRFQDLLSLMVGQKGQRFTQEELRHQALTFLFAGHDTTTNLVSWCLYLLARRPDALQRARQESLGSEARRPFLRCCLLETLRLYPSAPIRSRTLRQDDGFAAAQPSSCPMLRRPADVRLRRGTGVGVAINAVHRNPDHWPRPGAFEPGRFEEHVARAEGSLLTAPWAAGEDEPLSYLPFGAGPRRCIGERLALLEAEELCSAVLRRCAAIRAAPGPPPEDEMQMTLRARGGVRLLLSGSVPDER